MKKVKVELTWKDRIRLFLLFLCGCFVWGISSSPMIWIFAGWGLFWRTLLFCLVGFIITFTIINKIDDSTEFYPE